VYVVIKNFGVNMLFDISFKHLISTADQN
jgi:hypothetical protein